MSEIRSSSGRNGSLLAAVTCALILMAIPSVNAAEVRLITLAPGHFHAALVQKFMYPQVSPEVHIYAPEGQDLDAHLKLVAEFNSRAENPTHWIEKVHACPAFLEKMASERPGNVVVIAGNNTRKTDYIHSAVQAGLNVLADKPMAITPAEFELLRSSFALAAQKHVLLYDIMTERHEIASTLQRELARIPKLFGTLEQGSADNPAVEMKSLHYFFKDVAGKPLIRPAWFFDVRQEGEAIVDVGTHLVDLVQWECFPGQSLDWKHDIKVIEARRWPTRLTPEQFRSVTGLADYDEFLRRDVGLDGVLDVYQNGEILYRIKGVFAKVTMGWDFEAPQGAKDSHFSVLRGTRATLTIRQGAEQKYRPTLYVKNESGASADDFDRTLRNAVVGLCVRWPGLGVERSAGSWKILIPEKYDVGHEAHFAQVTQDFLRFLDEGKLPDWEPPNMLAKYYTTTEALRLSQEARAGNR